MEIAVLSEEPARLQKQTNLKDRPPTDRSSKADEMSYLGIFKLIAITLVMMSVATAAFLFCVGITTAITLVAVAILDATGLLTTVEDWSLWSWFPKWLWIVFGAVSVFCAFVAVQIRQDRAVRKKGGLR
jgi:hypothetical protein